MDMLTRKLLTGAATLLVAITLLSLPAAAQSISVHAAPRFEPTPNALEELPEDGRALYPMVVDLAIDGQFFCAGEVIVAVEVETVTHPAWAGMSLEPEDARTVLFDISGNNNGYSDSQEGPTAGLAWDTESAPPNHTHRYVVNVGEPEISGDSGDTCVPSFSNAPKSTGQAFLNITYPFADGGTDEEEVPCDQDPEQEHCLTDTGGANEGGDSPSIGAMVAIAALLGMVLLRRRQNE